MPDKNYAQMLREQATEARAVLAAERLALTRLHIMQSCERAAAHGENECTILIMLMNVPESVAPRHSSLGLAKTTMQVEDVVALIPELEQQGLVVRLDKSFEERTILRVSW